MTNPRPFAVDMTRVLQRKREMVDGPIAFHVERYAASGAELIMGNARLHRAHGSRGCPQPKAARACSPTTGSSSTSARDQTPHMPGLAEAQPLTNIEALELDRLPGHLLVLGGGYLGLELAQAYCRFGSCVMVVDHGPELAVREDADVSAEVQRILEAEGISVLLSTHVTSVEGRRATVCACMPPPAKGPSWSTRRTSWLPPGARPTPRAFASRRAESNSPGSERFHL